MSTVTVNRSLLGYVVRTRQAAFITPQSMLKGSGSTVSAHTTAVGLIAQLTDQETCHWDGNEFQLYDDHPTQAGAYTYGPAAFDGNNAPWFDATNSNVFSPLERINAVRSARGSNGRGTLVVFGDPGWSHPVETTGTTASGATTINVVSTQSTSRVIPLASAVSADRVLTNAAGMTIPYTGVTATSITGVSGVTASMPAGTKLWMKPVNSASEGWAPCAPSMIAQRVADLDNFLTSAKTFNGGVLPFGALMYRQEHKGRVSNGLGTGRAWESLDRSPDTWTPADDNSHCSFYPWVHCKFWDAMYDMIRGHADADIRALTLIGPYISEGDTQTRINHDYPFGSPDGSVAEWDWSTQAMRYFLKYAKKDANCAIALDYSLRDNNDVTGVGPDDTYMVTNAARKTDLITMTRRWAAEFGWPDKIEFAESYYWVNIGSVDTSYTERQQAAYELMDHITIYVNGVDVLHEWQKSGDTSGTRQTNKCSWVRQDFSSTATTNGTSGSDTNTGPGTKFLAWDYIKALRDNFGIGTQLVSATTDDTRLVTIASTTKTLVLNTASTSVTFTMGGSSYTLAAYSYQLFATHVVSLSDQIASLTDDLERSGGTTHRALSDQIARITDSLASSYVPSFAKLPRPRPGMRMTPKRYASDQAGWASGRTVVSTRAALVAALSSSQPVTIQAGAVLTGSDVLLGSNADVRAATPGGAEFDFNLVLDDTTGAVVEGLRFGAGFAILGSRVRDALIQWNTLDANSLADYGIGLTDPSGCVLRGNYTRRQRIHGQALMKSAPGFLLSGFKPCVVHHARWDSVAQHGLHFNVPGVVSEVAGQGCGLMEAYVVASDSIVEDVRLGACVVGVEVGGPRMLVQRVMARPSLAGVQTEDANLSDSTIKHVFSTGGQYGINARHPTNVTVAEVQLVDQTSASIRQNGGSLVFDPNTMRLLPATGGTAFLFVP